MNISSCREIDGATTTKQGVSMRRRHELLGFKMRSAAFEGDIDGVKKAHNDGVDINSATITGWTALDFAVRENHGEVSAYLRRQGGRMGEPVWTRNGKIE